MSWFPFIYLVGTLCAYYFMLYSMTGYAVVNKITGSLDSLQAYV